MTITSILFWIVVASTIGIVAGFILGRRSSSGREAAAPPSGAPDAVPRNGTIAQPEPRRMPQPSPGVIPPPATAGGRGYQPGRPPQERTTMAKETGTINRRTPAQPTASRTDARATLAAARSWGYQLQKAKLAELAASTFDVLVIDYALDGSDDTALTPGELQRLQRKPDGSRRIVLAYISIGEAESYRYYWNRAWEKSAGRPQWLLGENPEWEENYAVCFWDPGWQALIFGSPTAYIDKIIAQGFDGVYLDKCDVFEDIREHFRAVARARPNLEQDMVEFTTRLSAYAKAEREDFLIVMQNAETLLDQTPLRRAIDGVAKEELVFGLDDPEKRNSAEDLDEVTRCLDLLKRDGKPVFVVEYLNNRTKMQEAQQICASRQYVLAISPKNRELDRLGLSLEP